MFSLRPGLRAVVAAGTRHHPVLPVAASYLGSGQRVAFFSKDVRSIVEARDPLEEEDADAVTIVQRRRDELSKKSQHLVWESPEQLPAAPLPEDPKELAALDPADTPARTKADGTDRVVMIRQDKANVKQSPLNDEKKWRISFVEDNQQSEKWTNSLMGWTSSADPYQSEPPLVFENALDAVYFAKKRGWKYSVAEPIKRPQMRLDGAQYQDNFLPQAVAAKVQKERKQCKHWERDFSGASHYYRPLRYHGVGEVPQYGPNPEQEKAPHVEGYYKMR